MNISSRIERLVERLARDGTGKLIVTFCDGTRRRVDGGEAVDLTLNDPARVGRFESTGPSCGLLADLLNGLLEE